MSVTTIRDLLADRLGRNNPSAILHANQPTDQQPMSLFDIEEHTEHYLTLENGEGKHRGIITGGLAGIGGLLCLYLAFSSYIDGDIEWVIKTSLTGAALFIVPFLWETLRPLPLPILFNRRTRELYFEQDGELYHTPWDSITAAAYEFHMVGPYTGGLRNAALEVLIHRYGHPEQQMLLSLGLPMGKSLEMQKSFWEYLRAYMNNGPWFDENGNPSQSDAFVKSQLDVGESAGKMVRNTWERIVENYKMAGGRNYLDYSNTVMLICAVLLSPVNFIQDFTYRIAKRRARNRWPKLVLERLRSDGPTTRLVDIET